MRILLNNKSKIIMTILVLSCLFSLKAFSQLILSEVLNIRTENDFLLLDVARKYPQVKFTQNNNEVIIELLGSTFHKTFINDDNLRGNVLLGLNYLTNFSVNNSVSASPTVQLHLSVKPGIEILPKIISTKENILKIAILKPYNPKDHPDLVGKDLQSLYNSAVEEQTSGNVDNAIEIYKEVISKNKNFYLARYNLAKIYADKTMHSEAIRLLIDLVTDLQKLPPESLDKKTYLIVINTLGTVYYQTGYYNNARKQFLYIIKMDPNYYQAYYNIGLVNEKLKEIKLASESFKKATELKPDFADAYYHVGILSLILNEKDEALTAFKKVIELAPESKLAELSVIEIKKLDKPGFGFKKK